MASQWEQIKWIPGTKLMVDGFRYQNASCKSYLLTHYHSDHTTGLYKSFTSGLIFCTPVTARLLRKGMGLPAERICETPMNKVTVIEGHEVTPIDANHCPGACMFLIKTKGSLFKRSQTILHTGDMRWDDSMADHPSLKGKQIDMLFMDTTYAKPTHTHPPQDVCIDRMVNVIREERNRNPKTIFVCGSYHIGKERAYLGAAKILGCKVWCDPNKRRVLKMLDLPDDMMVLLTTKQNEALIHVDFLGALQPERLAKRIQGSAWTHAVGFRPTGWTYRRSGKLDCRVEGNVKVYGIPYSEHSSWPELRSCVTKLRPKKLVPTVNASNAQLAEIIVSRFADCMDLSEDKSRLDFFMRKRQKVSHPMQPPEQPAFACSKQLPTPTPLASLEDKTRLPESPACSAWVKDSLWENDKLEGAPDLLEGLECAAEIEEFAEWDADIDRRDSARQSTDPEIVALAQHCEEQIKGSDIRPCVGGAEFDTERWKGETDSLAKLQQDMAYLDEVATQPIVKSELECGPNFRVSPNGRSEAPVHSIKPGNSQTARCVDHQDMKSWRPCQPEAQFESPAGASKMQRSESDESDRTCSPPQLDSLSTKLNGDKLPDRFQQLDEALPDYNSKDHNPNPAGFRRAVWNGVATIKPKIEKALDPEPKLTAGRLETQMELQSPTVCPSSDLKHEIEDSFPPAVVKLEMKQEEIEFPQTSPANAGRGRALVERPFPGSQVERDSDDEIPDEEAADPDFELPISAQPSNRVRRSRSSRTAKNSSSTKLPGKTVTRGNRRRQSSTAKSMANKQSKSGYQPEPEAGGQEALQYKNEAERAIEEVVIDLDAESIEEQHKILQAIEQERISLAHQLDRGFARTRQNSIACYFK